jgi:hypothetical protein
MLDNITVAVELTKLDNSVIKSIEVDNLPTYLDSISTEYDVVVLLPENITDDKLVTFIDECCSVFGITYRFIK